MMDVGKPNPMIGMCNRPATNGKWGLWGWHQDCLQLQRLMHDTLRDVYQMPIVT